MASVQDRGGWFHLLFRYRGRQYSHALKTRDRREAEAHRGTVDRLLIRLRNREVPPPPADAHLPTYLLAGGRHVAAEASHPQAAPPLTLAGLRDKYLTTHANGALEPKTLVMVGIHFRHLTKHFGERFEVGRLTPDLLQQFVAARGEGKGKRSPRVSPVTIQKDIAAVRAAWNWAARLGLLTGQFPGRCLTYPKTDEKPGFQTRAEIERRIARGGLSRAETDDLWAGLFLTRAELTEFLAFAQAKSTEPHLFPMLAFAGHTGARRSELLRLRVDDVDLEAGTAVVRERKKSRGRRTTRRVPVSGFLAAALRDWLRVHPGGQLLFAWQKGSDETVTAIHPMMAYEQFRKLVRGTEWDVLKGWHVLRHSFISICAGEGVDQRVLQSWVGHLSAATHKRYTHLIPSREREILAGVFG